MPEDDHYRFAQFVGVSQRLLREVRTDSGSLAGLQDRQRCQSQCTPRPVAKNLETAEHHKPDDFAIVTYSDATEIWNVAITASDPIDKIGRLRSHDPSDHGPNGGNVVW